MKTPSFVVGIVNVEGRDYIYKHRPYNNTKTVLLVNIKRKILGNIYLYMQVRFPDSWEGYIEYWLV